jgi:glutathione S-transferase
MLTVHHLEKSRSQRVLWLLEELSVPYEVVVHRRLKGIFAPPELKKVHPLGKSPVVTDDGNTLAETGAILEYLVDTYGNGRLLPERGTHAWKLYRYYMHYAEGSFMPPVVMHLVFKTIERSRVPFFIKPIVRQIAQRALKGYVYPQIKLQLAFLENEIGEKPYFTGDTVTAADINLAFPLETSSEFVDMAPYPRLRAFIARIRARPAYMQAMSRGA